MKLNDKEFKRFKELQSLKKSGKISDAEKEELAKLQAKKANNEKGEFVPGNDYSWWSKIKELVDNSANFKSNYIAGDRISANLPYVVPGVLEIKLMTCYYPSVRSTDPANVWARDLYLQMFQKYRPASGYSASDLGIAILAGLEPVKLIAEYERIYGVINRYSVLNVNMPAVEAAALGLTTAEVAYLQGHMSDFRYDLNYLIRKAQRLCIPKDISFVADAISLLGYEYIDHNNPRGQITVFTLDNIGVYSDTDLSTGGSIQFDDIVALFDFNADNMCKALDDVLTALLGSDSIQRIYADLVVWFGQEAMLQFLPVPEDYIVAPVLSESIMHKVHNLQCMPTPDMTYGIATNTRLVSWATNGLSSADEAVVLNGSYHVYQYNDAIVTVAGIKDTNAGTPAAITFRGNGGKGLFGTTTVYGYDPNSAIIDGYQTDPGQDFIVEGSLLKYTCEDQTGTPKMRLIYSCVNWLVKSLTPHTNGVAPAPMGNMGGSGGMKANAGLLALWDWAPLTYTRGSNEQVTEVFGDLDVIIPISKTELDRVHRTCFLSGIHTDVKVKS